MGTSSCKDHTFFIFADLYIVCNGVSAACPACRSVGLASEALFLKRGLRYTVLVGRIFETSWMARVILPKKHVVLDGAYYGRDMVVLSAHG